MCTRTALPTPPRCRHALPAFTLLELIVVIAIVVLLIALLLPALGGVMTSARGFRCQMSMRTVAFDFAVFADESLHGNRGNDALLGGSSFTLETFQESQYGVDEFWRWGDRSAVSLPDDSGNDPMRCPEVTSPIELRTDSPCSGGAVSPPAGVSYGFNLRLHREEFEPVPGAFGLRPVILGERVLDRPDTPLLIDVDGETAERLGVPALYTAPSAGSTGPFGGDRYWFPSRRHGGTANVAFVGGHVLSAESPAEFSGWLAPRDRVHP